MPHDQAQRNKAIQTAVRSPRRRRLIAGAVTLGAAAAAGASLPAWVHAAAPRQLRVGYQKGALSLIRAHGVLEQRLAPLGATVKWVEFSAGPVQLEALGAGSIDFGDVGEAPPIFAQAAGTPLVYVGATVPRPYVEAVLVKDDSELQRPQQLKGKRIALNKGSNVHYFLVKLLEKHGLKYGDVTPVWLAPADARAAFERGAVDAWAIWEPYLAAAQQGLKARILADADGVVKNRAYYFSTRDYARDHADLLRIALEELGKIDAWAQARPDEYASELAGILGLPRSVLDVVVRRYHYGTLPITRAILDEQQQIADTFLDLRLIPRKISLLEAAPPWLA
ncbi:sulfonate ABC transporter substrate-binding protein [Herbaspirillum seropedicae]|uniref:Putative aliphatic sulfonates-binding protein n=1 Tax=Herbaspirillum seropedicae (strain SmR1) TaxID=757424 RepID=D8IQ53_HERSS|nr:sulfonate ABC transporter substrate-binding protein [Herbaspirillum seropedicae]ADJ63099.1 ABC-type alkanesulfonates transport system, periplasmic component protein [Herbaspirillum seropedicae SmR1]AKN65169.1 ABC transporter substrate-binding protein [Herbaspirillum seropedicae]UMU21122.1 sulfonate ABC transporter substrate-binding protein [Herbaspirillum seropedicae]